MIKTPSNRIIVIPEDGKLFKESVYLYPGSSTELTEEQEQHILKQFPDLTITNTEQDLSIKSNKTKIFTR